MPTMNRRAFLTSSAGAAASMAAARSLSAAPAVAEPQAAPPAPADGTADRAYWVATMDRIARPVLSALAQKKLKQTLPSHNGGKEDRSMYACLEALGRTLAGLASWLELGPAGDAEGKLRAELAEMARAGIDAATDPQSPDYMNFTGGQSLVDSAFLAHAMLRAPNELWKKLPPATQKNVIAAIQQTRAIKPPQTNWLLFCAMVEALICHAGGDWKPEPIATALTKHMEWYVGDGTYGDGPKFHWDYYNSYVIQPMLIDVIEAAGGQRAEWAAMKKNVLARAQRFAAVQERLISPEGTFPVVGRSVVYRFGAFQLLGQIALRKELPAAIKPAQVRCGLTAVIRKLTEAPGTFDEKGFLRIGFFGHQPGIPETYISTGSLYLCTVGMLPLGLPATDEFWSAAPADWTGKKIWSGQDVPADHALD